MDVDLSLFEFILILEGLQVGYDDLLKKRKMYCLYVINKEIKSSYVLSLT